MKRVAALVGFAVLSSSCARVYHPPTAEQPHAVIKLRRTYVTGGGTNLHENADVLTDDEATTGPVFQSTVDSSFASAPRVDGLLVHPVPFQITVRTEFFHIEMRQVEEQYQVQVPYQTTETYDCGSGYGSTRTYQTCTRMVTQYRSETRTRTVTRAVEIADGACGLKTTIVPKDGHVYLLDYTYRAKNVCDVTCVEQIVASGEGNFRTQPCPR